MQTYIFQLWPENPTYQVYIPGFQGSTSMLAHPNGAVEMTPHSYINGSTTSINRARSVSSFLPFYHNYKISDLFIMRYNAIY